MKITRNQLRRIIKEEMQKIINDGLLDENSQQIAEQTVEDLEKMEKARLELGDDDLPADVGRLLSPQPDKKLPPISAGVKQLIQTNFKIAAGEAHKGEPTPTKEEQKAADSQLAAMLPDYIRKIDQYTGRDKSLVTTWKKTIDDQSESYPQAVAELKRVSDVKFWSGLKPTPKPTPELKKGKFAGGAGDDYTYEFSKKAQDKTKETGELHATVVTKTDTDTGLTSKYGPATFKVPVKNPLHAEMMGDSNVKKFFPEPDPEPELPEGWTEYVSDDGVTWYYPTAKGPEGNMQEERPTEGIAAAAKDLPPYTLEDINGNIKEFIEAIENKVGGQENAKKLVDGLNWWKAKRDELYPDVGGMLSGIGAEGMSGGDMEGEVVKAGTEVVDPVSGYTLLKKKYDDSPNHFWHTIDNWVVNQITDHGIADHGDWAGAGFFATYDGFGKLWLEKEGEKSKWEPSRRKATNIMIPKKDGDGTVNLSDIKVANLDKIAASAVPPVEESNLNESYDLDRWKTLAGL